MVGRYVFTEHDARRDRQKPDAVAVGSYPLDSHGTQWYEIGQPDPAPEGFFMCATQPYEIPFRAMLPQDLDNLLVPVALSATHAGIWDAADGAGDDEFGDGVRGGRGVEAGGAGGGGGGGVEEEGAGGVGRRNKYKLRPKLTFAAKSLVGFLEYLFQVLIGSAFLYDLLHVRMDE